MTSMWKDASLPRQKKVGMTLFEASGKSDRRAQGSWNALFNLRERQRGLWTNNTKDTHEYSYSTQWRENVSIREGDRDFGYSRKPTSATSDYVKTYPSDLALIPITYSPNATQDSIAPNTDVPAVAVNECNEGSSKDEKPCQNNSKMVQVTEERIPELDFKTYIVEASGVESTDDGVMSFRLDSLNELESPIETAFTEPTLTTNQNPFHIFRLKHARSPVEVSDSDLSCLKAIILSGNHNTEELSSWFRESISVTNLNMMKLIIQFLCDIIRSDVHFRPFSIRMLEIALLYHPDELVQAFSCEHVVPLFEPEVDDDIGGRFMRLLLLYKATFDSPGIIDSVVPLCLGGDGEFIYQMDSCATIKETDDVASIKGEASDDPNSWKVGVSSDLDNPDVPIAERELPDDLNCGKIESMMLLKICSERAGVSSAFDIKASRLRDWLCTIWFELPATRPHLPLIKLCINWIDSRDDPVHSKDAAFALLQSERDILGEFEGGRLLMIEVLCYIAQKNGDVSIHLSKIIDIITEGEENVLYAVLDSIIAHNFTESDMLDLWCLLCILPWPVYSINSTICRLMSCTFILYYKLAYDRLNGKKSIQFESNPMGILENALRMCVCRAASPILAKNALLQTLLLVELSPLPASKMTSAPLILSSLCPFLWKCHFIWSNCGRDVDPENVKALRHLYDILRKCVFCTPLSDDGCQFEPRNVPMFPRVQTKTEGNPSDSVNQFIHQEKEPEASENLTQVSYKSKSLEVVMKHGSHLDSPRGLRNLGNSCYYNSILQALFHTRQFVYTLLMIPKNDGVVGVYKKLFQKLLKRGKKPLDPGASYKLLPSSWRQKNLQQDVTEAFRHVLESIDETMDLWKRVFVGMVLRRIKCNHCGNLSDNSEVVVDFPFPLSGLQSVQDMFDDYCKIETLTGENMYFCSKCNTYRTADMWNVIASPPSHLLVILNRQVWHSDPLDDHGKGGARKQLEHVRINHSLSICKFDYHLYGAIFHSGESTTSGHYYFVGRDSELNSGWYICDDSKVKPATSSTINDISEDGTNSHVPYVLLYRCKQAPPTPI